MMDEKLTRAAQNLMARPDFKIVMTHASEQLKAAVMEENIGNPERIKELKIKYFHLQELAMLVEELAGS